MKTALLYVPVVLSMLMLGAHFMRGDNAVGVFAAVLLIALLFVRRPWVLHLMQVVLVLGTLEWLRTMYALAQMRALQGQPYGRMLVILGVVAGVTFCSAILFRTPALKKIYRS